MVPLLSGLSFFPSSPHPFDDPNRRSLFPPDDIYAPFDSLHTDISDYIWPTSASTVITSSFADYRRTHFHEGIDISTNKQKGYPVYASRDGFVFRIRVSPFGYGKMLYVRHPDGFVTTYAHLQKFNDSLNNYVKSVQKQSRRYSFDIEVDTTLFPVQKGEMIAYTGDTGVGSAHLHFEVRDSAMNPVNPFLLPAFSSVLEDVVNPTFHSIAFSPLDHSSIVQGKQRSWLTSVRRTRSGEYVIDGTVRLTGSVGIGVRVTDRTDVLRYLTGVHRFELYVDDELIFSSTKNWIAGSESKQIAMYYDSKLLRSRKGRFEKLYIEEGNRLPFYNRLPEGAGIIETTSYLEGIHKLKIAAWDVNGNQSVLTAKAVFNHPPEIKLGQIGSEAIVIPTDPAKIRTLTVWSKLRTGNGWKQQTVSLDQLRPAQQGYVLPINLRRVGALKVVAENQFGTPSNPEFLFTMSTFSPDASLRLEKEFERNFIHLTIRSRSPITATPQVQVFSGTRQFPLQANAVDINEYSATVPLAEIENGRVRIEVQTEVGGHLTRTTDEFNLFVINPEQGGVAVSDDGDFKLTFPPQSLYQLLYCRIEKSGEGYSIYPKETVLRKPVIAEYRIADKQSNTRKALFFSDGGGIGLLQAKPNEEHIFTGKVSRFLGDFVLLTDHTPPSISRLSARYSHGKLALNFRLSDNLSGLEINKLTVLCDDAELIGEYDSDTRRFTYEGSQNLSRGNHTIVVQSEDRLGNHSTIRKTLRVSNP